MKTDNTLLALPPSRRRPPRSGNNPFARPLPTPPRRSPHVTDASPPEDTFWTGYFRLLIFALILTLIGTLVASL
jgi:hypothetical protein